MAAIIHPLLTLLASLTRQELARQVTYLKAENQILRSKLPKRIELSNQERRRLVKHVQAMRRLGHSISRQTVKNVLVDAGLGSEPHDNPDTRSDFLKRHAATMWQCDFACKKKWTIKGTVEMYFLVFIHIGTRQI